MTRETWAADPKAPIDCFYVYPTISTDTTDNSLRFFSAAGGVLTEVGARSIPLGFAVEGVCFFRNSSDGGLYVIAVGDGGEFDQFTGATITPRAVVAAVARALHFAQANRAKLFADEDPAATGSD